ncbi:MAG: Fe-only nitrogenase accessory AnfO family protein [Fibrobacterota bacterium]|jgi:hypothetical protein
MHNTTMAFAVNETGISVPLEQAITLRVYDHQSGEWIVSREWSINDLRTTISESLSDAVRSLAAFLQGCFTLVVGEVPEALRAELERLGIDVWELRGEPMELAEIICHEEDGLENLAA